MLALHQCKSVECTLAHLLIVDPVGSFLQGHLLHGQSLHRLSTDSSLQGAHRVELASIQAGSRSRHANTEVDLARKEVLGHGSTNQRCSNVVFYDDGSIKSRIKAGSLEEVCLQSGVANHNRLICNEPVREKTLASAIDNSHTAFHGVHSEPVHPRGTSHSLRSVVPGTDSGHPFLKPGA